MDQTVRNCRLGRQGAMEPRFFVGVLHKDGQEKATTFAYLTLIRYCKQIEQRAYCLFLFEFRACCSPRGGTLLVTCFIPQSLHDSFFSSSSPAFPFPLFLGTDCMEYNQLIRHQFLVSTCKASNLFTLNYKDLIGFVKNELITTEEAAL